MTHKPALRKCHTCDGLYWERSYAEHAEGRGHQAAIRETTRARNRRAKATYRKNRALRFSVTEGTDDTA